MKSFQLLMCRIGFVFFLAAPCFAEQHPPTTVKVINLGAQAIVAFSITGMPFRDVALTVRPGDALTPAFGDGQMDYEVYWRLESGITYGVAINLQDELPATFHGDVLLSIHDDYLALSWSNVDPAWIQYSQVGDPSKIPRPIVPFYAGCTGAVLTNPMAVAAWKQVADRVRQNVEPHLVQHRLDRGKCALDWYVPKPTSNPRRPMIDEDTAMQLRRQWHAEIEEYKSRNPVLPVPH